MPLLASGRWTLLGPSSCTHFRWFTPKVSSGAHGVSAGIERDIDADAGLIVARVVGAALLTDGPGDVAGQGPWAERAEAHQATGMVVAQLGIPESDALALIRAHAYSHNQSIARSAHAVVTKAVRFSTTAEQEIEST